MRRPLALVGPTAAGKTALALRLAPRVNAEVVSVDSRQVYRGMDIGTAKATAEERAVVPHHALDLVDPGQRFSAAAWAAAARSALAGIAARGRAALLVGGTGFYLRALTHPLFREPPLEPSRRERLTAQLNTLADDELHRWLAALDPAAAARLRPGGGRQRLLRALELPLLTGRALSWWQRNAPPEHPPLHPLVVVLAPRRETLYARIDARVDHMARAGLLAEVRALVEAGHGEGSPGMNATGYAELLPVLRGEATLPAALDRVRANTRAYARRQLTWFRHQLPPGAVWLDAERSMGEVAARVAALWRADSESVHVSQTSTEAGS